MARTRYGSELDISLIAGAIAVVLCISVAAVIAMKSQDQEDGSIASTATNSLAPSSQAVRTDGATEVNRNAQ